MRLFDISVLGWIHTLTCVIALPAGLALLAMTKGTARHKRIGRWYLISMVIGSVTALGLYAPINGIAPGFNRFHWMAIATLIALAAAYVGARRQSKALWAYVHPAGMIVSYYMLIGALINETFARADFLQVYQGSPVLGLTQAANMALFFALLIAVMAKVGVKRARLRAA
ncbi:MAG: DUF2306 domain-containing protein [Rhodospirillaceae bacterium]